MVAIAHRAFVSSRLGSGFGLVIMLNLVCLVTAVQQGLDFTGAAGLI